MKCDIVYLYLYLAVFRLRHIRATHTHRVGRQEALGQQGLSGDDLFLCSLRLVFWFGDLNFRIQDHGMHFVRSCIENQTYQLLWSQDQVTPQCVPPSLGQEAEGPVTGQPASQRLD